MPIADRIKELRRVRAGDLTADPRNYRRHPQVQREALQGMLNSIGYADALIARETDSGLVLIDGHLRADLDAEQDVPVLVVDLDESEAGQLLASLDPLAGMAEIDDKALTELLDSLDVSDDLEKLLAGIHGLPEVAEPTGDPEAVPDLPLEPISKRGDVWQLGRHRLMCGDSASDFADMGDASSGLLLTDPPYGIDIVKGKGEIGGAKPFGHKGERLGTVGGPRVVKPRQYIPIANDDRPFDPSWLLSLGKEQVIFGGQFFASQLADGNAWLCWDKGTDESATFSGFELAWTSFKGRNRMYRHKWSGMVRQGERHIELQDRIHPTQKPVGLFEQIIADLGNGFNLILDPYLGSGSTLIAAERQSRTCYAMEIEPRYVDMAVKRWENYTGQKAQLL